MTSVSLVRLEVVPGIPLISKLKSTFIGKWKVLNSQWDNKTANVRNKKLVFKLGSCRTNYCHTEETPNSHLITPNFGHEFLDMCRRQAIL